MKIHDKLWYIINPSRKDNLAYMTYWEDDVKCQKRMDTGRSWATPRKEFDRETLQYLPSLLSIWWKSFKEKTCVKIIVAEEKI